MKKTLIFSVVAFASLLSVSDVSAQKKTLDHSVYDGWKQIDRTAVADNGKWIGYEINPAKGDGLLYIQSPDGKSKYEIERGSTVSFFGNGDYATYKVKPFADSVIVAKRKKVKSDKLPVDTTYLFDLTNNKKIALPIKATSKAAAEAPVLFYVKEITIPKDTTDKKSKERKYKQLVVTNVLKGDSLLIDSVGDYTFDKKANLLLYTVSSDSLKAVWASDFNKQVKLFESKLGKLGKLVVDDKGEQGAFLATVDTNKVAPFKLYYFNAAEFKQKKFNADKYKVKEVAVDAAAVLPEGYAVGSGMSFSRNGSRLVFDYAKVKKEAPKDTLAAEEKFSLDLWSTSDKINYPQQIANKKKLEDAAYSAVYLPKEDSWMTITDRDDQFVSYPFDEKSPNALFIDTYPYTGSLNWINPYPKDVYVMNTKTGKRELVQKEILGAVFMTPDGKYIISFENKKAQWFAYDIAAKTNRCISEAIPYPLYDEAHDKPELPSAYGAVCYDPSYSTIYVYDKYDVWALDLAGKKEAICVTNGWGRKNEITLRWMDTTPDNFAQIIDIKKPNIFTSFNRINKQGGYYSFKEGTTPVKLMDGDYKYTFKGKAKHADVAIWQRENFNEFRDLWLSNLSFSSPVKLTHANPQMKDYKWGSVELMKWNDFEGKEQQGLLYKPENFDPNKKYPVIVYFYETHTDELFKHHQPQPSWSIVIPSMFTSDDYVVFMPDINYTTGYPGESCYNSVVSGSNALIERGIADPKRMGLQGQSWGGYQITYLVTRTNMFRCASPGAPVTNMTSAYSGIRTGSGLVRMFQYEYGQSRIGANLWEAPMRYIENSALFYAPKVETPLLIRHDDADEAVPFSQGVEFFMALKRCGKEAWMLNYNKEPHNLKSRPARIDWTIRMHQFFDYYLKDAPKPRWMDEGISITEKGIDQKYDYVD